MNTSLANTHRHDASSSETADQPPRRPRRRAGGASPCRMRADGQPRLKLDAIHGDDLPGYTWRGAHAGQE